MYILKRSWYYITRKKGKSITIGIILFIVATLVLTGLLINSAANKTFEVAKNKLGSNIIYKSDTSSIISNAMENRGEGERFNPGELSLPDDYINLTTKEVETIVKNSKYVKDYKYSTSYTGNPVDFEEYSLSSDEESSETSSDTDMPDMFNGKGMGMNIASLTISGVQDESDVINSINTLLGGSFFTDEQITNGENVIMIEKKLAELNDLVIGDTITIEKVEMKRGRQSENSNEENNTLETTYTIVGIYQTNNSTDLSDQNFGMDMNNSENAMYVPYTAILKMQENGLSEEAITELEKTGYTIESVTFIIDDPENSDAFIEEVKNMEDIDLTYRSLSIDNEAYQKMVGNIEGVASTAKILVIVVIIAGAFIIMLLSMLTIKDRKYEIGVLLSLGESKPKILFQLIAEVLIVGILSFALATGTTSLFAQKITNYLLNNEVSSNESIDNNSFAPNRINAGNGNVSQDGRGMMKNFNMKRPDTSSLDVETIDELTVKLTPTSVLSLYGVGLLIIVVGNTLQAIFVLKLNPKEIMLDR